MPSVELAGRVVQANSRVSLNVFGQGGDAHVGRRAIALFWTLNPDYFEGVSLTALANRLGLHKAILSAQAVEARRKFGIKNRGQAHGWNFGKAEPKPAQSPKRGPFAKAAMSDPQAR